MQQGRIAALLGGVGVAAIIAASAVVPTLTAAPRVDVLPADKQALEDVARQHQAGGKPADKGADPGRPASIPDPPPVTGLLGPVAAPMSEDSFTPINAWAGWVDDTTYEMVWGGWVGDSDHGAVLVLRRPGANGRVTAGADPQLEIVRVRVGRGPVTIARVSGSDLVLTLPNGNELIFNPAVRAFR